MSESGDDKRRWRRVAMDKAVEVRAGGTQYSGTINDISAGGASLTAGIETLGDNPVELSIDDFGEYQASVVRHWDEGVALAFDLDEDDQYSLQEELEAFRRENDLD
ncbi:MAG: PilZ domain-containing protein [Proteobacteria bacterium]|nr:PilZ domain-containing protein [Pseudomonadota bacterium]